MQKRFYSCDFRQGIRGMIVRNRNKCYNSSNNLGKEVKFMAIPNINWLEDPEVFAVGREAAHSDHKWYAKVGAKKEWDFFQSLNGTWYFSYAQTVEERDREFYKKGFDFRHFDTIQVPAHMELQGYDKCQYVNTMYPWDGKEALVPPQVPKDNPVGSYIRSFVLEENLKGKRLFLSFKGVETAFYLWVNGAFIGYSEDSFTPSDFEITDYIKDGENVVAVQVFKRSSASWIEDQDFWRFSGIFRDVVLYAVPKTHLWDLDIKTEVEDDYKKATVQIGGNLIGEFPVSVKVILYDKEHKKIDEMEGSFDNDNFSLSLKVEENLHLWSAEIPYLYQVELELYDKNGELLEWIPYVVGFRRLEMIDNVMCINGKRLVFHGVNRHEFHPEKGRAISEEEMLYDICCIKRNNMNAVRTSHYPNQTRWYELCDEYGVYVIDEANLESHGTWSKPTGVDATYNVPGSKKEWEACVVDRARSVYERDKNHPSILMWSCGNESYAGTGIEAMANFFHEKDKERFVHYEGVFWCREFEHISDMESRMYAKPQDIEEYLKNNPKKPFINCEYIHAMGNSLGGMELYQQLEDRYEMYQGGFIWDYMDQSLWKTDEHGTYLAYGGDFDDRSTDYCFCTNGIVYGNRTETPKMQEVKALYSNLSISFEENCIFVYNKNAFLDTSGYDFVVTVEKEGLVLGEETISCTILAGEKKELCHSLSIPQAGGEYVLQVSVRLNHDEPYAKAGYEVSFGQKIFYIEETEVEIVGEKKPFQFVCGDINFGVYGDRFSALFSRVEGGIVSLVYDGIEYVTRTPKVTFWRATVDNDRGRKDDYYLGQWLTATLCQRHMGEKFYYEEREQEVKLYFFYETASVPKVEFQVVYTVKVNGTIEVEVKYDGVQGLPTLPAFGMEWKLKKQNDFFRFYGMGEEETYIDRVAGGKLGVYQKAVKDNMAQYLIPQECGNRVGVRYLEVFPENVREKGLRFEMMEVPFECSVLPYSTMEMEQALHLYELPTSHHTYVRILEGQMGVGGDDTWGAPVQEIYKLDGAEPRVLRFCVKKPVL